MARSSLFLVSLAAAAAGCSGAEKTTAHGALPPCSSAATTVTLGVGAYAAYDITADSGCAVFPANASTTDSAEYLVVVQAAGGTPGDSSAFQVEADRAALPAARLLALSATGRLARTAQAAFDRMLLARSRRLTVASRAMAAPGGPARAVTAVTLPAVGSLRTFSVCSDEDCSVYKPVAGRALVVGQHVALYVDTLAPAGGLSIADLDSLEAAFDGRVYPLDTLAFGRESDVDSNGVVIVLLTNLVNALVSASSCQNNGYVTGFFDASDLDPLVAAQHNDGEVFYGLVPDPSGSLSCAHGVAEVVGELPVTFAHEFEHMINFVQHVVVRGGNEEDDWLDESLAKYAEELTADSYLPADTTTWINDVLGDLYDGYQYLLAPDQHYLLTTTDQNLADVGAGWLYVRYLVDQMGAGVTRQLVQTSLTGTANVAAVAGLPFATTVERWALANWVSDLPGFSPPGELAYASWSFRSVFADLNALDPGDFPVAFPLDPVIVTGGSLDVTGSLRAGSGLYLLVHQPAKAGADTLHVNAGGTPLPATLVPQFAVIRLR